MEKDIPDFIIDWIVKQNGHFYVCGDVKMANGVNLALRSILAQHASMSQEDAEEYITKMKVGAAGVCSQFLTLSFLNVK